MTQKVVFPNRDLHRIPTSYLHHPLLFINMLILLILAVISVVKGQGNGSDFTSFLTGLTNLLSSAGLSKLSAGLVTINHTKTGASLLATLHSTSSFMMYAPVDKAWEGLASTPDQLVSLLAYHIAPVSLNSTDVADPRSHTIAFSLLKDINVDLPGSQSQVLVLEKAPNRTDSTVLIRGDTWNATSIGRTSRYVNLELQPVDRVLTIPSTLVDTCSRSLAAAASEGTKEYIALLSSLSLTTEFTSCHGCTFFVPVDVALKSPSLFTLNSTQMRTILKNHVINGSTIYSPSFQLGTTFTTASGNTLAYASNDTGNYIFEGGVAARFLRSDIPVRNGVVHLISDVLTSLTSNPSRADSAAAAASSLAAKGAATLAGVTGTAITSSALTTARQSSSAARVKSLPQRLLTMLTNLS